MEAGTSKSNPRRCQLLMTIAPRCHPLLTTPSGGLALLNTASFFFFFHPRGSTLLPHDAYRYAAESGCSQVVLTTGAVMKPAMRLYTRCGYEHWRQGHLPPQLVEAFKEAGETEAAIRGSVFPTQHPHFPVASIMATSPYPMSVVVIGEQLAYNRSNGACARLHLCQVLRGGVPAAGDVEPGAVALVPARS